MSECNHTHTSSCSPAGIYLYVTCMDCGAILNESPEGARLRNECPKFEAEQFSRGSCKHCHHSAQYHYDALAADRRALLAEVDRLREVFASGASTMAQATDEIERLRDWQRRAVVELTLAQYRLRDHPDQDGFNNMRALIEEAGHA